MDFQALYNRTNYIDFLRNTLLPEDFEKADESIRLEFKPQYIRQVTKIGHSPSLEMNIYEVEHGSENDPRVSLSKESFRLLAEHGQKQALVLFISKTPNYRFSLVTVDLELEGKKVKREYSNPRRYSFFLGPDAKVHTPQEYLIKPGRVKGFEDLKKRFSIEVVNKDFYTQIAILFTKLTGGKRKIGSKSFEVKQGALIFPSPDDTKKKEFAVRLIGRLVFCWFLKKKHSEQNVPLLPEELLSMAAVNKSKSYYHNTLEPLFFEVLNTPAEERAKDFTSKPWLIIPFLNGGLFTPHEDDYYGSNEQQKTQFANILQIPDNWLRDLLGIFETYNFTIDENTPVDVELSIDPEMLGRIFENLLAEINPETGETARKATGSYYTRRPIVEYMVDESLKQYLLTKTGLPEEKILPLLSYSDESTTLSEADKNTILDVLDTIKIIDPACGSGAFPMGILQKILLILQKIDTDSQKWLNKILSKIENVTARKEFEKKLKKENWNYVHKLGIVQSSIYGVDIQQIAVEISKLRFFLSLIVDENVSDKEPNRAVKPLPNLEFKFVCANTLIGLPNHGRQQTMFEDEDSISELKRLRDEYLNSYGKEKKDLEDRFRKVQSKMFEHSLNWGGKETQTAKLSQWNPFLGEPCGWFDPEWMFGIIEGFDIVIANPPYATNYARKSIKTIHSYMKKLAEVYEFSKNRSSKRYNLTMFFLEKATHICSVEGLINMIVDAGFDVTVYREIRKYLLDQTTLLEKVENLEAFENVNSRQTILMLRNGRIEKSEFRLKEGTAGVAELVSQQECIDSENSIIGGIRKDSIIDKMEMGSSNIDELYYPISGMNVTNRPESGLPPFLSSERLNANYHKAIFSGNISAYRITYPISEQLESSNSRKYLYICYDRKLAKKMNKYLEERGERSRVSIGRDELRYKQPKIFIRQSLSGKKIIEAAYTQDRDCYCDNSVYVINQKSEEYCLYYLLALLNSPLMTYYARAKNILTKGSSGSAIRLPMGRNKGLGLKNFPVKRISPDEQIVLIDLVKNILLATESEDYLKDSAKQASAKQYQKQIDQMVYNLYGLTADEIAIVEKSS